MFCSQVCKPPGSARASLASSRASPRKDAGCSKQRLRNACPFSEIDQRPIRELCSQLQRSSLMIELHNSRCLAAIEFQEEKSRSTARQFQPQRLCRWESLESRRPVRSCFTCLISAHRQQELLTGGSLSGEVVSRCHCCCYAVRLRRQAQWKGSHGKNDPRATLRDRPQSRT